jgi:hypothetical protein
MSKKAQAKIDEFAFVLLVGLILISVFLIVWNTPTSAIPSVEPNSISLTIGLGETRSSVLNITGFPAKNISLVASENIKSWVKFSKNNFDVYGSELVSVSFSIPSITRIGTYKEK